MRRAGARLVSGCLGLAAVLCVASATPAAGPSDREPPAEVVTRFEQASLARDLPSSRSVWSLLETAEPMAIADRISGAGLTLGEPARFSMRGASWTQNRILLDGAEITDPLFGGTSLLAPDPELVETIEATSALAPVEQPTPGVTLALRLREPAASWQGTAQAYGLPSGLQSQPTGGTPSIARFGSLADASAFAGGPIGSRLRALASGRFARVTRYERAETAAQQTRLGSGLVRLVYTPRDGDQLSGLAAGEVADRPSSERTSFTAQPLQGHADALGTTLRWSHAGVRPVSAFVGYWTARNRPNPVESRGTAAERLEDGPVPYLVRPSESRRSLLSAGARMTLPAGSLGPVSHAPSFGLSLVRASAREAAGAPLSIPETVAGVAARVWDYSWAGDSRRHTLELAAWASDRLAWGERLAVEPGLRLERTSGGAAGAVQDASWTTLVPRITARLLLTSAGQVALFGGWGEYRERLLLEQLAFGDPNAPSASVYRWLDADADARFDESERGPLVARVGPGAPEGRLSAIDAGLHAPRLRELVAGIEAAPGRGWRLRLIGTDRRESDLIESANLGVPTSDYSVRFLPDPGGDIQGTEDDQLLPVFDRDPASPGQDRYLLTNVPAHHTRHQSLELRAEKALGRRFALLGGASASRTEIEGANRGFRAEENDQGIVGELYDEPNADVYARGRSFFDRAFTIKLAGVWRAPGDWRIAAVARYQDGQPFGRLVVVPDLSQGAEAVPATARGQTGPLGATDPLGRPLTAEGHRFTYTLTVDLRLEKGLRLGARRLALLVEAFNLLDTRSEVEEDPVWGPSFRQPTAAQPPRAIRLGARLEF